MKSLLDINKEFLLLQTKHDGVVQESLALKAENYKQKQEMAKLERAMEKLAKKYIVRLKSELRARQLQQASAQFTFRFTVQAKDERGNKKTVGGDTFLVTALSAEQVRIQTTDKGDGTYSCSCELPSGPRGTEFLITASLNGAEVAFYSFSHCLE